MERMGEIVNCDTGNRSIRVQPGITNKQLQDFLEQKRFFWPPDPSSAEFCTVGGNLACNAAGPRAVKYGTTRENVLQLKAVTGYGESIITGSKTSKGVVGLDLTRLIIGSEGTLAIITEAELKIHPLPEDKNTIRALYKNHHSACSAIQSVNAQIYPPCALEFMDHHAIKLINAHSNVRLPADAQAMLMVEVDGDQELLRLSTPIIENALNNEDCVEIQRATNNEEKQNLWQARKALSPILRNLAPNKINEDVVVPVPMLSQLVDGIDILSNKYQLPIVNFGHAGNGNLHVNIMFDAENTDQNSNAKICLDKIFDLTLKLGGTISGEHGIGLTKRDHVTKELSDSEIKLMVNIKKQFDPNNILNPDKNLPLI